MAIFGETADLVAALKLNDQFTGPLKGADRLLGQFDAHLTNTQGRAYKAGQQIGTGIQNGVKIAAAALTGMAGLLLLSAKEGQEAQNVQIKFSQAVQNSGKITADYVQILQDQALALSNLAGADDEAIKSAQTRLIQMGLTGQQVAQLTPLILDTATRTGKDLDTITLAVGRAVQGSATSLGRLGIIIPKAGKATKSAALTNLEYAKAQLAIKENLDKSHGALTKDEKAKYAARKAALDAAIGQQKLTDAQKQGTAEVSSYTAVVNALQKGFGGTAQALSGQLDTRLKVFNERIQDIREDAGIKLLPVLTRIVDVVGTKLVPAFGKFIDAILPHAIAGLERLAAFLEGGKATEAFDSFLRMAQTAAPIIKAAAEDTLFIVEKAVGLFSSLPPEIQALAVAGLTINKLTGGLVTNLAGGLISAVLSGFKGVMSVNAGVVNVNAPLGTGGGVPGGGGGGSLLSALGLASFAALDAAILAGAINAARNPDVQAQLNVVGGAAGQRASQFRGGGAPVMPPSPNQRVPGMFRLGAGELTGIGAALDAAEQAQQARNAIGGPLHNLTRNELRANIKQLIDEQKRASGSNAREIGRHIARLQSKLDNRIATTNRLFKDAQKSQAVQSAVNVAVTVRNILDSRVVNSSLTRYQHTYVNGQITRTSGFLP